MSVIALLAASTGVALGLFACDRARQPAQQPRVWTPSVRDLHNSYTDGSGRYTGQTVSLYLPAFSYLVAPEGLHWHGGNPKNPPDIVFAVRRPPADNTKALTVEGVCRGQVVNPAGAPRFHVLVEATAVTAHP